MGQLEELQNHRLGVMDNIEKSFGTGFDLNDELEKARSGVYADNAVNRKLNRVGQKYGSEKKPDEPKGGSKQPSKEEQQGSYQKMATEASDNALKRAATDKNAAPEVKAAAQAELKKRGGGENSGNNGVKGYDETYLKKLLSGETNLNIDPNETGKDSKFGEFSLREFYRVTNDFKNASEKELSKLEKVSKKDYKENPIPHYAAYLKAVDVIKEGRKNGDENFKEKSSKTEQSPAEKRKENVANNSVNLVNGLKNSGEVEMDWLTTKSGIKALKKFRKAAMEFSKKNPDAEFTPEMCEAIAGLPIDEFIEEYGEYNGIEDYANAVEEYFETIGDFEASDEEDEEMWKFQKEMKKRVSDAQVEIKSVMKSDQGQLRDDKGGKKAMKEMQSAAAKFVKNNPDLKLSGSDWEAIVDGENLDRYKHYAGFKELNEAIDNYIND